MNIEKKKLAKKSIEFFKRELLGNRLSPHVRVNVREYKNLEANFGYEAFVEAIDEKPGVYRDFFIALDAKMSEKEMLKAIAHEMVHVKQYARKELHTVFGVFSWKGTIFQETVEDLEYNDYIALPWEAEAFARENELLEKFLNEAN